MSVGSGERLADTVLGMFGATVADALDSPLMVYFDSVLTKADSSISADHG